MKNLKKIYSPENDKIQKRRKIIKNTSYSLIVALTLVVGATLIAVNTSSNKTSNTAVNVNSTTISYGVPVQNATINKDYSNKELQYNETLKQWEIHKGIDLVCDAGAEVYSISNGTVTNIYTNYLEGTVVEITHANGVVSIYKSLNEDLAVSTGKQVKKGDKIGTVSSSMGRESSTGNHLHFEMKVNGVLVDPNSYIDFTNK